MNATPEPKLPPQFSRLETFVERWAVEGSNSRLHRRSASTREERAAFYEAANPLLKPMIDYLDTKPLRDLDPPDARLMNILLSFAHVSLAIERQKENEEVHARRLDNFTVLHAMADR